MSGKRAATAASRACAPGPLWAVLTSRSATQCDYAVLTPESHRALADHCRFSLRVHAARKWLQTLGPVGSAAAEVAAIRAAT